MSTRNYNAEASDTTDHKYSYNFDTLLRNYMWRRFQPLLRGGNALEMGCYMGDFTVLFDQHYADLNVIEAADILIKATQKRVSSRVRFIHSTFEAAEISERFDNIFLIHTLEHLDDPVGVMRKAGNWLKPNGRFFVAVPNAHAVSRRIAVKMGLITHNSAITPSESAHGHRITYSLDTLERDVRDSGLSIIDRGGVLFKPLANF